MKTQLIESNPAVMMGKPVIAGTRITVELILEKLAAGESVEQILESHPHLTREAVLAALECAAPAEVNGEALRALDERDQELDAKATRFKEEVSRRLATGPATPMDFSTVKRRIGEEVEAGRARQPE